MAWLSSTTSTFLQDGGSVSKTLRIYATNIFIWMDYVYSFQKYYKQNDFYSKIQFYGLKIT